jgi:Fic family protein
MREFTVASSPPIDLALKLIHLRFGQLHAEQFAIALAPLSDTEFRDRICSLPLKIHHYLFREILSNAGLYRNYNDSNQGGIYFGPNQKFLGRSPSDIMEGVNDACSCLGRNDSDPVTCVVAFYQQFVLVHPFYDANGRIGRFITDVYLSYYGYHISWKRMHQNQKWLSKLNACHQRVDQDSYGEYLQYLVNHWQKFILHKEDIEPPV